MITAPGSVLVANISIPLANELVSYKMPVNTTHFLVRARNSSTLKISFNDLTDYLTIGAGGSYSEEFLKFNGSISFQSSSNNEVVELVAWYAPNG